MNINLFNNLYSFTLLFSRIEYFFCWSCSFIIIIKVGRHSGCFMVCVASVFDFSNGRRLALACFMNYLCSTRSNFKWFIWLRAYGKSLFSNDVCAPLSITNYFALFFPPLISSLDMSKKILPHHIPTWSIIMKHGDKSIQGRWHV